MRFAVFYLIAGLGACDDSASPVEPRCVALGACFEATAVPAFSEPVVVAPSATLPPEVISQTAHNNLDVVMHEDRLFLALRTAPSHFASADTHLYVVSTADQATWRFEGDFHLGRDLREPRFVSIAGRLFLYFAVLGTDPLAFEPGGTQVVEYRAPGDWSPPEAAFAGDLADFIPWRIQRHGGEAWLIGYAGGAGVYTADADPIEVHWLKSTDGRTWQPLVPSQPVVLRGGVSETDFARLDDGATIAVGRNEAGDGATFGSKVCRAEAASPGAWRCVDDPRKYDSPLVLTDGTRVWLVGRRNVSETGYFDLGRDELSPEARWGLYQADYWNKPKRCAVWSVDPTTLEVSHLLDLPSAGDTCFASAVDLGEGQWLVYNYSSPFENPDIPWIRGQRGPTLIYRTTLALR